jgi:NADH dehydrogenase
VTRLAITGGTGFVGSHLAERLRAAGDEVVLLSRATGFDLARPDVAALTEALRGCAAVVHTAGINREIGTQTYDAVHIRGTQALVAAARSAGVEHIGLVSFLRARPDGPTAYHRSKWAAESIIRESGMPYTVIKSSVIYGRGDHMLDHLSRALFTAPIFSPVGLTERPLRPVAVDDVARILEAAAHGDARLIGQTVAVLGPDTVVLGDVVRRVARIVGRRPRFLPLPVWAHVALAHIWEATMRVPLLAVAQVHILAEGVVEPAPYASPPPEDLSPQTPFDDASVRAGLPEPGPFSPRDLRWWPRRT